MAKSKDIIQDYIKDLETYRDNIVKYAAESVRDVLEKTAKDAISEFYASYEPSSYKRHYYNFEKNSFKPYFKNHGDGRCSGGIDLTPELMDDIYRASRDEALGTEFIFDLVYAGFHGLQPIPHVPKSQIPAGQQYTSWGTQMSPSPRDLIEDKYKYINNHIQDYWNKAERKAYSQKKYK